jgi:hypothetical protein
VLSNFCILISKYLSFGVKIPAIPAFWHYQLLEILAKRLHLHAGVFITPLIFQKRLCGFVLTKS